MTEDEGCVYVTKLGQANIFVLQRMSLPDRQAYEWALSPLVFEEIQGKGKAKRWTCISYTGGLKLIIAIR